MINESSYTWTSETQISIEKFAKTCISPDSNKAAAPILRSLHLSVGDQSHNCPKVEPPTFQEGENDGGADTCIFPVLAHSRAESQQCPKVEPPTFQEGKNDAGAV